MGTHLPLVSPGHLLWARLCSKCGVHSRERNRYAACPQGADSLHMVKEWANEADALNGLNGAPEKALLGSRPQSRECSLICKYGLYRNLVKMRTAWQTESTLPGTFIGRGHVDKQHTGGGGHRVRVSAGQGLGARQEG